MKKISYAGKDLHIPTRWWEQGDLTPEENKSLGMDEPMFEGDLVGDFDWSCMGITKEQSYDPAFDAVARADYNSPPQSIKWGIPGKRDPYGKIAELCKFVRDNPLSPWGREVLADFIYRKLVRQRRPIYQPLSRADMAIADAKVEIDKLTQKGVAKDKAVALIAKKNRIPFITLENAMKEKRASTRRARKGLRGAVSTRQSRKKRAPQ